MYLVLFCYLLLNCWSNCFKMIFIYFQQNGTKSAVTETPSETHTIANNHQQVVVTSTNNSAAAQPVQNPATVVNSKPVAVGIVSPTPTATAHPQTTQGESTTTAAVIENTTATVAAVADEVTDEQEDEYVSKGK